MSPYSIPRLHRLFPGLLGCAFLGLGTFSPAVAQSGDPIPTLSRRTAGLESPTTRIKGMVDAGPDGWASEAIAGQIAGQLGDLGQRMLGGSADTWVSELLLDSFSGSALEEFQPQLMRAEDGVRVERWRPGSRMSRVGSEAFESSLKQWLKEIAELRVVQFKLLSVNLVGAGAVEGLVRFHVAGTDLTGTVLELHGDWSLRWAAAGPAWKWDRLDAAPYWRIQTRGPFFHDVTGAALEGQDEAVQQLRNGIDWYSGTLDAAVGIDIYGHNGIAVADIDGDGHEDFYVCQPSGLPNRLFRNRGDGRFEDVSARSGTDLLDLSSTALFFDFDNDADADLLVVGQALMLFRNDGHGAFDMVPVSESGLEPRLEARTILTAVAAADYDRDGDLDVYVASYAWRTGQPGYRYPTPYHDATNGSPNLLFRNDSGKFTDVTRSSGIDQNNTRFSLAAGWEDYDLDGDPDLYVANDFGRNNLYRNDAGRFVDVAASAGVEDLGAGMSVSWGDYDNDGRPDLYVGNMFSSAGLRVASQEAFLENEEEPVRGRFLRHAKGNTLFRNLGDGTFEDVTEEAGVAMGRWAWSSQFVDFDADGLNDLLIANGYITNEDTKDL